MRMECSLEGSSSTETYHELQPTLYPGVLSFTWCLFLVSRTPVAPPGWESDSSFPLFWWTWPCWDLLVRYFGNVPQRGFAGYLLKAGVMKIWDISEAECCSHSVISEVALSTRDMIYGCWADLGHRVCQFPLLGCSFPPHSALMRGTTCLQSRRHCSSAVWPQHLECVLSAFIYWFL